MDSDLLFKTCFPLSTKEMICGGVGVGWYQLVAEVLQPIEDENGRLTWDAPDPSCVKLIEVAQIKEKFGGLRLYVDNAPVWVNELVSKAEAKAWTICCNCGESGAIKPSNYWLETLCERCNAKPKR